ncbi:MAG: 50S ribosomal protein L25 [Patescibacteria group bacterium]|nr:50S ribosomal protein L25 [bacterium]MDZ4221492.1 50S ribosomal protein L25 [Patescibacteria group bacterium]
MTDTIALHERSPKGTTQARSLRKESLIPGVLYGDHIESRHFSIAEREIQKLRRAEGSSTGLIDVQLQGESAPVKAIVQDIQSHPVSGKYEHIDLYQVRMDKKLHTEVHLAFTGESSAVKDLGGILVKQHAELPIECLPGDLVSHIDVPIDSLKTFEDVIRIKDISLPQGVATSLPEDEIVAAVSEPRSEEDLKADLESEIKEGEGPEVLTEKKAEEGEAAAGESSEKDSTEKGKSEKGKKE